MNCTVELAAGSQIDGNELVRDLACELHERLNAAGAEIAHLKVTLSPGDAAGDIAVLNLVRNDGSPEMSHSLQGDVSRGELIVNLRAEADPELLKTVTLEGLGSVEAARAGVRLKVQHLEHFRPGKLQLTYRFAEAEG